MKTFLGRRFGNYRIVRWLGHGAFADVYLAKHLYLNRWAAIKILRAGLAEIDGQAFIDEALIASDLIHPHIVRVLDFGIEEQIPFLIMDYAPNGTLRQRFPAGSRVTPDTLLELVEPLADAIQHIHDKGYIHGDIKSENILLGPHNELWLSDFGISVVVHTMSADETDIVRGTIAYMAPELLSPQGQSCFASDQYALAIMIYGWLCGTLPFRGTPNEIIEQHLRNSPPSLCQQVPSIPRAVERVVFRALAKDPERRFATVQAFCNALKAAFETPPDMINIRSVSPDDGERKTSSAGTMTRTRKTPSPTTMPASTNTSAQRTMPRRPMNNRRMVWRETAACLMFSLLVSVTLLCALIALHTQPLLIESLTAICLVLLPCAAALVKKNLSLFVLSASMALTALIPALLTSSLEVFIVLYFGLLLLCLLTTFAVSISDIA